MQAMGAGIMQPVSMAFRDRIKRFAKRVFLIGVTAVLLLTAVAYVVDYAVFRYLVSNHRQAFGQITVNSYDAVLHKNGKTEYIFNPPEARTCANALFPRAGYVPCWYLKRHTEQRTDI